MPLRSQRVREIAARIEAGDKYADIAAEKGVTANLVSDIAHQIGRSRARLTARDKWLIARLIMHGIRTAVIADVWRVSRHTISAIARANGRRTKHRGRAWTPEQVELLGTDTDAAIAARLGRTKHAVEVARIKRGIAAKTPRPRKPPRIVGTIIP